MTQGPCMYGDRGDGGPFGAPEKNSQREREVIFHRFMHYQVDIEKVSLIQEFGVEIDTRRRKYRVLRPLEPFHRPH